MDKIVLLNAQKKGVNEILLDMFRKMNTQMFKWLIRIILKDVKVGLGTKGLLYSFHDDANEVYETNANLRKVTNSVQFQVQFLTIAQWVILHLFGSFLGIFRLLHWTHLGFIVIFLYFS